MNPKITIAVDAKNRAIASMTGMVTVGAKIDVEITGLPSGIADWAATDKFTGKSVRFRIVDEMGHDLVRFPIVEKTNVGTDGDQWQVTSATASDPEKYASYDGTNTKPVDFDTDKLRRAFRDVPFNDTLEFGVIIDSIADAAQFATGRIKIRQWSHASTEDPTVLPDWRETLNELNTKLGLVDSAVATATTKASEAGSYRDQAASSQSSANGSAASATMSASAANESKLLAQAAKNAAESAKTLAEVAASHYPIIGANGNWFVWNVAGGAYADTGYAANGGHNIFQGKVFTKPTTARGWYELLAYVIREMGGNIDMAGITPGSAPSAITMTATDGVSKTVHVTKLDTEYTLEVE